MSYKIFLDDERFPAFHDKETVICRSYKEAVTLVQERMESPIFVDFDHDLGERENGFDFAKFLVQSDLDCQGFLPENFGFSVHSQNPIGAKNIADYLNAYLDSRLTP